MGRGLLKTLPLAKLKRYVAAYNIKIDRAVEKEDLIDAMVAARVSHPMPLHAKTYWTTGTEWLSLIRERG